MAQPLVGEPGDSVVEVEFRITDSRYPLVSIPDRLDCRVSIEQIVPRGNDTYAVFYHIDGANPDDVIQLVNEYTGLESRILSDYGDGGTIEVVVTNPEEHFVVALTDTGAIPREVRSAEGVASIVAEVPPIYETSKVVEQFRSIHPTAEVVACRQKNHEAPLFTIREFQQTVEDYLTGRQREILRAAYVEGYFDWPRRKSAQEVAADLDISHPTFSQHLRTAERKIFSLLFNEE